MACAVLHSWVPDEEAKGCMACKNTFTTFRRRVSVHRADLCGCVQCTGVCMQLVYCTGLCAVVQCRLTCTYSIIVYRKVSVDWASMCGCMHCVAMYRVNVLYRAYMCTCYTCSYVCVIICTLYWVYIQ